MSSKEIMLNIVAEEFKDENIHIMTNGSVTDSCVLRAHLMSSGCSWAFGTWSWSSPKVPPDLHKVCEHRLLRTLFVTLVLCRAAC